MKKSNSVIPGFRNKLRYLMKPFSKMLLVSLAVALSLSLNAQQQATREISGTVKDSKGEPVPGASVIVKGTVIGQNTDMDGNFRMSVPVDAQTIVISFIGMKLQEVDIAAKSSFEVTMVDEMVGLDEVVVVGYGTQKKVTVTGAVATVSNTQLVQTPVANVSNMLVGRSPGLLAVQRTGEPGEDASSIRIRGISTFTGSQTPLIMVDGIETNRFDNIDPNEIENIAILKDASATAVYGVRGANGVLIITTKRGKLGKPQISFSTNYALNTFTELRERMGAYDYTRGWNEALKYDSYISGSYTPQFSDADLQYWKDGSDPLFHPNVDWVKVCLKDVSHQSQNNLNIRGGTDKVKYFISAGIFNQGGIENNTTLNEGFFDVQTVFNRVNFRSNFDFTITKRLSASINISDQIEQKNGMNVADHSSWMRAMSLANPVCQPGVVDNKILYFQTAPWPYNSNPLQNMYGAGYMKRYRNYLNGTVRLDYDLDAITKGLSVHGLISYNNFNEHKLGFTKTAITYNLLNLKDADGLPIIVANGDDSPFGSSESVGKNRQTYAEFGLDYQRTFGDHTVSGKILYNQQKKYDPDLQFLIPSGYQGLVGRVAYDYKNRYLAEFDMGYNGTENFAPGKRFGFFPAVSMGWVVSEESFFPKGNLVSFLKFRGSYGEVGNDQIGGTRFLYNPSSYTAVAGSYWFGLVGSSSTAYDGLREGKIGNPDITWERSKKTNIGMEINLFKDKIKFSGDYFNESRDNILANQNTIPLNFGSNVNLPVQNLGKMSNSGFDGEVTINLKAGKFNYWIKANYTYAHNVVEFRDEIYNPYPYQYTTGQRFGQFYGPIDNGLYNTWDEVNDAYRPKDTYQTNYLQPGDIHWRDINGDGLYDQYDSGPIGYSNFPERSYAISFGGDYKGLDFSVLLQGAGNVSFDGKDKYVNGWNNKQMTSLFLLNSWSQERVETGQPIYFPRYNITGGVTKIDNQKGTYFVIDARYIRIRNAEIGYTFNKNRLFSAVGVSSARIYVNGSNLWVYAPLMRKKYPKVDPEFTSDYNGSTNNEPYPKTRVINFGANINF